MVIVLPLEPVVHLEPVMKVPVASEKNSGMAMVMVMMKRSLQKRRKKRRMMAALTIRNLHHGRSVPLQE